MLLGLTLALGAALPSGAASVKVTVNGTAITDVQIAQRTKLHKLEGGGSSKAATKELIDDALQLGEAKRLGIVISDAEVGDAVLNVARNIKVSQDKLIQILNQNGVNVDTLRERLRAALAWSKVTQMAIMPRVQMSEAELDAQASQKLDQSNSFDYILKEVVFVIPGGKGSASGRTADANRYRKSFQGCDNAVELSLSYTDAAVIDVGRRHATQLPPAIAKELAGINVGGITKPRVVEAGVSMLAVCSKAVAEDTTFIKSDLRQQAGSEALKAEAAAYLEELRSKARIVYE